MNYEELDERTRVYMLSHFEEEQSGGNAYQSKALSPRGLVAFPDLMRNAIKSGNEATLAQAIDQHDLWCPEEEYTREGSLAPGGGTCPNPLPD